MLKNYGVKKIFKEFVNVGCDFNLVFWSFLVRMGDSYMFSVY